jgi:para-nitrobenzyl esterase
MIYPQMTPPERRIRALTAEEYWVPSLRVAEAFVRGGGSAWMYRLDDPFKTGPLKGQAAHTHDVHFVWNSPQKSGEGSEQDQILAQQVHSAWVAFLAGGSPAAPGLPAWEPYGLVARSTMILNSASQMEKLPWDEERRLWEGKLLGPAGWKLDERPDPPAGHASDSSHQNSLLKIPLP